MHPQSFNNGRKSSMFQEVQPTTTIPYDRELKYNRVIEDQEGDPSAAVRSFDAVAMLKELTDVGNLANLYKVTLGGRAVRGGIGVWDALFNDTNRSVTSCVLTATNTFTGIPRDRILRSSTFLNYDMKVSRIYFNQIQKGDRIGVAINDMMRGKVYVFLYIVDDICSVLSQERDDDERAWLIPSLNLRMEHAVEVDYKSGDQNDNAIFVDMEDGNSYPEDLANPFLQRLVANVYRIKEAYPWKPHFLPNNPPKAWHREKLEKRLSEDLTRANVVSYREVETRCAQIYEKARQRKAATSNSNKRRPSFQERGTGRGPQRKAPSVNVPLPVIEVVSMPDRYMVKFHQMDDPSNKALVFAKSELADDGIIEYFLTGKDLTRSIMEEVPDILMLNPEVFGEKSYIRYFSMNF